jgi:outer membrane scaffolding protein for murein synthesis (MipA/OmpV family)
MPHRLSSGLSILRATGLVASLLTAVGTAWAQPSSGAGGGAPLWELGVLTAGISQQAYPGSDEQVRRATLLPYGIYRGRLLRADGDSAGLRAIKTDHFELDVGLAGAFGAGSRGLDARRGMPRLGTLLEFGPRARWRLGDAPLGGRWRLDLPLRAALDASDGLGHRGWALEPELTWERRTGPWRMSLGGGAILADRKLADTFYGVDPAEAVAGRPAYEARAGLVAWRLSGSVTRELSPDWRLFGFARVDTVHGAANRDSPLVRQTTGATVGLGLTYTWMRSTRRAVD